MAWTDVEDIDPKWTILTAIMTIFLAWMSHEIMERYFGMEPRVAMVSEIQLNATTRDNPIKSLKMNQRMSKGLDSSGRFRITTRGAIYNIKGIWTVILITVSLYIFIAYPDWFIQHFIELDRATVNFWPYQHVSASIAAFYAWEVCSNRYGKLNWSVLLHHWLTVFASILILMGVYTPFSTWYGFTQVACSFSMGFMLGFRAIYSNDYPELTRKCFRCQLRYVPFTIILNFIGQFYMLIMGFSTGRIAISSCITMIFTMIGWFYDDQLLIRALHHFSKQKYEDADILSSKSWSFHDRDLDGVTFIILDSFQTLQT